MGVAIETTVVEIRSAKGSFGFRFMARLCVGWMRNPVNSTMISTALVAIARDFQATVAETGLLIGGLYITSAIAQPTMGRPHRCAPCVPRGSLSRCSGWRGRNICAQSSRIDLGARSLGNRHVGGLSNGDENSAQPGGTDTICRTAHGARHSLDVRTLHRGDRSGPRRNTHRPRWLEDGLHGEPSSGAPRNPARISLDSRR